MASRERQLAAVMFSDIEGYTALMHENELLAQAWRERHRKAFRETHQTYEGRIVQYFGDGTLSVFESALNAVKCAIEIQQLLRAEDAKVPLRIGLHLGEIVWDGDDIFGDGVNIASRVESFSVPGAVLISDRLYEQIRNQSVACRSMGFFHLKNVSREVELFAIEENGLVVPDKKLMAGKGAAINKVVFNNLPRQTNTFVGRETELIDLPGLIHNNRLVTITGPGGTGKTRLSIAVAERLAANFEDGVYWVALAPLSQVSQVVYAMSQVFSLMQETTQSMEDILIAYLQSKRILLLLDNFEHVKEAAGLVESLLSHCQYLNILVTSRGALNIYGEQEYPLSPLALPQTIGNSVELGKYASVRLFCQRAQAVQPDFELADEDAESIAHLCIHLDGLPLAIELAAARIRIFPPQLLLSRLSNNLGLLKGHWVGQDARHHTLTGTIDWSFRLLELEEQLLFMRFSVFAGGANLEAIEKVCCHGELKKFDAVEGVTALVDKSLLQKKRIGQEFYFSMLETIRFYARDLLEQSFDFKETNTAHAQYYLELAEQASPQLTGKGQVHWLAKLEREQDNLRTAILWYIKNEMYIEAYRFGIALWRFWMMRTFLIEGIEQVRALLDLPHPDKEDRLKLLNALATLYLATMEYPKAQPIFEEILNIRREQNNPQALADAMNNLGWVHIQTGQPEIGQSYTQAALKLCKQFGDSRGEAASYNNLGFRYFGKPDEAYFYFEQCLQIRQDLADDRGIGMAQVNVAWASYALGHHQKALELIEGALNRLTLIKEGVLTSWAYINTAIIYFDMDNIEAFEGIIKEIEKLGKQKGTQYVFGWANVFKGTLAAYYHQEQESDAYFEAGIETFKRLNMQNADKTYLYSFYSFVLFNCNRLLPAFNLCIQTIPDNHQKQRPLFLIQDIELIAMIVAKWGKKELALLLLAKTFEMRRVLKTPVPPRLIALLQSSTKELEQELGEATYHKVWNQGLVMDTEQAIQLVMELKQIGA